MVTLAITVNGRPFCESDDISTITMTVEPRRDHTCRVTLHAADGERAVQYLTAALAAGDAVVIRAVDLEPSEPEVLLCGFCGRESHAVRSLITGDSTAICDGCATALGAAVGRGAPLPLGAVFGGPDAACGFCNRAASAAGGIVMRNGAGICGECLRACEEMGGHGRP